MTEQEKFEAWIKPSGLSIAKRPNGAYQDGHVDDMWDGWQAAIASRKPLYSAVNAMMAHLGAHGEIDTRNPLVTAVMDALHDVDGGVYQPAKEIDMEALKRGQDNDAAKIWTPEAVADVLEVTGLVPYHHCYWLRVECQTEIFERFRKDAAKLKFDFEFYFEIDSDKFEMNLEDLKSALKQWREAKKSRAPMPLEKAEELAHRTASRYTHKSDRSFTAYTFLPHTLEDFVRKVERFHGIGE